MTPEKILEVVETYRQLFIERNIHKTDYPHNVLLEGELCGLEHCHGMLDKIIEFIYEGRIEKAFRWLGFIQGFLWGAKIYSLDDLKGHNRTS